MNPVLVSIGPFALRWYGVLIVGGIIIAAYIATFEARRRGENPDHVWNTLTWCLLFGIIGARLYHVFSSPADGVGFAYYREHPLEAINPFGAGGFGYRGLGIYGGLIGGIFAIWLYTQVLVRLEWKGLRAKKVHPPLNLLRWFDIAAPGVLLAQAIGRFGNFVNQELYGPPTTLPWAFHINPRYPCQVPPNLPSGIQICGSSNLTPETLQWYASNGFHPTFFYESAWNLVMFLVMIYIARRYTHKLKEGDLLLGYFIAYPLGRLWVEAFRPDAWKMGALATAQWISIISIVLATAALIVRHRRGTPRAGMTAGEPLPPQPPQEMAAEAPEPSSSDIRPTGV
jgi:phosphatidylglycerol:prolipoprotein diacylglycerol transferase